MINLSLDLVNDNGISQVALGFFTALFGMVTTLMLAYFKDRKETRESRDASLEAAKSAEQAVQNTKNIGNGFAGSVLGALTRIDSKFDDTRSDIEELKTIVRNHLEWHKETEKGKYDD